MTTQNDWVFPRNPSCNWFSQISSSLRPCPEVWLSPIKWNYVAVGNVFDTGPAGVNPDAFSRKFGAIVDNSIEAGVSVEKLPGRM